MSHQGANSFQCEKVFPAFLEVLLAEIAQILGLQPEIKQNALLVSPTHEHSFPNQQMIVKINKATLKSVNLST